MKDCAPTWRNDHLGGRLTEGVTKQPLVLAAALLANEEVGGRRGASRGWPCGLVPLPPVPTDRPAASSRTCSIASRNRAGGSSPMVPRPPAAATAVASGAPAIPPPVPAWPIGTSSRRRSIRSTAPTV